MSAYISKSVRLPSPPKFEDEAAAPVQKQGIVSILDSDCEKGSKAASLRRTLSADMSSKKWLAESGFCLMKKTASSEGLSVPVQDSSSSLSSSISEEEEEGYEVERPSQDEVWLQIQMKKEDVVAVEKPPGQFDIWSSILSDKVKDSSELLPPPYVHPLVKRSSSSLSQKSLEICTESLGSETGSDEFSSYPPMEICDDSEEYRENDHIEMEEEEEEGREWNQHSEFQVNYSCSTSSKRLPPRSFPPPLLSLASGDGASLHMQFHRENGRLVAKAVPAPSKNYFHAERQDGRLLLTLVNTPPPPPQQHVFDRQNNETSDECEETASEKEEEEEREMKYESKVASGVINVHRSALMLKKLMGMENRNPTWVARLIHSPPASAASFNPYDYFWRAKPNVSTPMMKPKSITQQCAAQPNGNTTKPRYYEYEQKEEVLLLRGNKADYIFPLPRNCKEARRSILLWEPYCIATS